MSAVQAFDRTTHHAGVRPAAVALIDDARDLAITYGELEDR